MRKIILIAIFITCVSYFSFAQSQYSVGSINLTPSVGPLGNAQLSTAIFCPPGRLGITPQIAIQYNSMMTQTGDAGLGYSLVGLSAISRAGTNFHLDNRRQQSVTLTNNDNIVLDGERLILVSGNQWGANSTYRTENDQFARITYTGDHFIVDTKDGGKLFYGNNASSKLNPVGSSATLSWYITHSFDNMGNFIRYNYSNTNAEITVTSIEYSGFDCRMLNTAPPCGHSTESPFHKVEFTYNQLSYNEQKYVAGFAINKQKVIQKIEVFADNVKVRTYNFEYVNNSLPIRLNKISEQNGQNEELHPLTLNWQDDGGYSLQRGQVETKRNQFRVVGDFDGDGAKELLTINAELDQTRNKLIDNSNTLRILKYKHGNNTINNSLNNPNFFKQKLAEFNIPFNYVGAIIIADLEGDGDDDILFQSIELFNTTQEIEHLNNPFCHVVEKNYLQSITYAYHAIIMNPQPNGVLDYSFVNNYFPQRTFEHSEKQLHLSTREQLYRYMYVKPQMADMDGDGLPDLIMQKLEGNRIVLERSSDLCGSHVRLTSVDMNQRSDFVIRLSTLNPDRFTNHVITANLPLSTTYISDINGNGRAELFNIIWNNTTEVYEYNPVTQVWDHIYGANGSKQFPTYTYHKWLQLADFNGDGKTDLLYFTNNKWWIAYSNGVDFIEYDATQLWFGHFFNPDYPSEDFNLFVGDFNGDGRMDIAEKLNTTTNLHNYNNACHIYYSLGHGFQKIHIGQNPTIGISNSIWFLDRYNIIADFDGDGKADILQGDYEKSINRTLCAVEHFSMRSHKITAATTTTHHSIEFTYQSLPQSNRYSSAPNPNRLSMAREIKIPLTLVTEMREKTTGFRDELLRYHYRNLLYHIHGRGIIGFERTATVHIDTTGINRTTLNTFSQNLERPHILNISEVSVFNNATNLNNPFATVTQPISKSTFSYAQKRTVPGRNIFFIHLSMQIDEDLLRGIHKTTCYEYDINGNLIQNTSQYRNIANNAAGSTLVDVYFESADYMYAQHGSWLPSSPTIMRTIQQRVGLMPYLQQTEMAYTNRGLLANKEIHKNTLHYYLKSIYTYDRYGNVTSLAYDSANNTSPNNLRPTLFAYTQGRFMTEKTLPLGYKTQYLYNQVYGLLNYAKTDDHVETFIQHDGWGRQTHKDIAHKGSGFSQGGNYNEQTSTTYSNDIPGAYIKNETTNSHGETTTTYLDAKGRKIQSNTVGYNGKNHRQTWGYTTRGFLVVESNVHDAANPSSAVLNHYRYDMFGRMHKVIYGNLFDAVTYTYNGLSTTETQASGEVKTTTIDATGAVSSITDNGGTITYHYTSFNKPSQITTSNGQTIQIQYNAQLQKMSMTDPNAGTTLYDYNAFGELLAQRDANNNETVYEYDVLGRVVKKKVGNYEYIYSYINQNGRPDNGRLQREVCKLNQSDIHTIDYSYNDDGLLQQTTEHIVDGNKTAITNYNYDNLHRLTNISYPNISLNYEYDSHSNLMHIRDGNSNILWQLDETTAQGMPAQFRYGNGYITQHMHNAHGQLLQIQSIKQQQVALDMSYNFHLQSGNLLSRTYNTLQLTENFGYDNLSRLTSIEKQTQFAINQCTTQYNAGGNITAILNGVDQSMGYANGRVNALNLHTFDAAHPASPVLLPTGSTDEHTYSFNALNRPAVLQQQTHTYTLSYGLGQQRIYTKLENNNSLIYETYYLNSSNMEIIGHRELTYLYAQGTPFGIHEKEGENEQLYYLHLDYQGSIKAITNEQGNIVEERDYDAWGRPRNPNTLNYTAANPFTHAFNTAIITNRGYTFHEHIFEFSLINMNARMYDPVLRRVISPDNYIQAPDYTQSFNRYSYCWNNPLKYTDPSGEIIFTAITVVSGQWYLLPYAIAADVGGIINTISNASNINSFGEFAASYGAGAFAGAATVFNPVAGAAVGGAVLSGTNNAIAQSSGDFKNVNWGQVGLNAAIGGATGLALGATAKYVGDPIGKYISGKITNESLKTITHRSIQFAISGAVGGATDATATAVLITKDYSSIWESTWKGFAWGALGGAVWGGIEAAGNHANKMNTKKGIKDGMPDETLSKGTEPFNDWISSDPSNNNMVEYLLDEATISAKQGNPYGRVNYSLNTPWYQPISASYKYYSPQLWKKISLLRLR